MTEAEAIAALIDLAEVTTSQTGVWCSLTFGYLTVAYFVGKALSRFQCLTISIIYTVIAFFFVATVMHHSQAWILLLGREHTIYDEIWLSPGFNHLGGSIALFLSVGTLVSLYFMYNVRNSTEG
jgi:high-affinity Fe2+/Pb2+ permease